MNMLFDALSLLTLLIARGYGVLTVLPPLMKAGQGWMVRLPIALALALPSANLAPSVAIAHLDMGVVVLLAVFEFGIGMIVGALFLPLFAVPRAVGALVDVQAGLQSIQLFDPGAAERSSTLFADLFEQIVWVMFIGAGGLAMMAHAYGLSQQVWPMGKFGFPDLDQLAMIVRDGFSAMGRATLMIVAPFAVVLFTIDYAMALIGRSAPQLNVLTNSIAIKITFAMIVFVAMLGPFGEMFRTTLGIWMEDTGTVYRVLKGARDE